MLIAWKSLLPRRPPSLASFGVAGTDAGSSARKGFVAGLLLGCVAVCGLGRSEVALGDEGDWREVPSEWPGSERLRSVNGEQKHFTIRVFRFEGNTVFGSEELQAVVQSWTGRDVGFQDLEEARIAVTRHYVDSGYVNSGALIRYDEIDGDTVTMEIVEGTLAEVNVTGNQRFRSAFLAARLRAGGGTPLNTGELRRTLELLRVDYPLDRVNAQLRPGPVRGQAALDVRVSEKRPESVGVSVDNSRPPRTGAEQVDLFASSGNLTGHADTLDFALGVLRRTEPRRWTDLGLDDLSLAYEVPVTVTDLRLGGFFRKSSSSVLEESFRQLDIASRTETYGVSLSHPIIHTPNRKLHLTLTADRQVTETSLLGQPYSFGPANENGRMKVTSLRLAVPFSDRSQRHAFSQLLTLSWGIDALGATINGRDGDARYWSLHERLLYVRRLGETGMRLVLSGGGQISDSALPSQEQFSMGGIGSLRGYPANTMVRDRGVMGTAEVRIPVPAPESLQWLTLEVVPFMDAGWGENAGDQARDSQLLSSVGLGLVASQPKRWSVSLFWGKRLREIDDVSNDLLDQGVHFSVVVHGW